MTGANNVLSQGLLTTDLASLLAYTGGCDKWLLGHYTKALEAMSQLHTHGSSLCTAILFHSDCYLKIERASRCADL